MTFITVLDGADTIGGNKILLEENGRGLLLDFGMNFARHGEYYQEFLKERSNRGIHDLIHLDMIPRAREIPMKASIAVSAMNFLNSNSYILAHAIF